MGQENGAPGSARTAPARAVPRYGLRWRARGIWRALRWRATGQPLYVMGLTWTVLGALMLLSTVLVPGLARHPAGPCITGVTACTLGTWACIRTGRWRR